MSADENLRSGVLLDVDGTLLDTNYLHALAWWQAMRDVGIEGITMTDTHQAVGIASDQLIEHLSDGATKKATKARTKRYAKLQSEVVAFTRADEIYAGPADLLDHWAESVLARLCWVPVGVRTPVCRPKRPYGGRNRRLGPRCRHKRPYGFRLAS